MALNSFRKCCSNVLSAALCLFCDINENYLAHNHRFLLQPNAIVFSIGSYSLPENDHPLLPYGRSLGILRGEGVSNV